MFFRAAYTYLCYIREYPWGVLVPFFSSPFLVIQVLLPSVWFLFIISRRTTISLVCSATEEGRVDPMVSDSSSFVSNLLKADPDC